MARRFTLIELMTVLAVLAILTAMSLPQVYEAQLRAKQAEIPTNIEGIMGAIVAYEAAYDELPGVMLDGEASKAPREWPTPSQFDPIGFRPDGAVHAMYLGMYYSPDCTILTMCTDGSTSPGHPCAGALSDLDGDAVVQCAYQFKSEPLRWTEDSTVY